jgi:hypothetical protein
LLACAVVDGGRRELLLDVGAQSHRLHALDVAGAWAVTHAVECDGDRGWRRAGGGDRLNSAARRGVRYGRNRTGGDGGSEGSAGLQKVTT